MKYLLVALAVAASVHATPLVETKQARFVDDLISAALEDISNNLVEAGLDPYYLDAAEVGYELPVPILFSAKARVQELHVTGISDIVINQINFSLFTLRLTLDISLPKIHLAVGDAGFDVTVFGNRLAADLTGSVSITQPRVSGLVSMRIGLSGISVSTVNLQLSLANLFSLLDVNVQGRNVAPQVNKLISDVIPSTLQQYRNEINELLNIVVKTALDDLL